NGDILTASASGTTRFTVANSGNTFIGGTLQVTGAISAPTSSNTINGVVINSQAVSNVSTLNLSGAITGATVGNTINGIVINSGAVSSVSSLDTIAVSATSLTFAGAGSIAAGGTANLTLDAGSTGKVQIGNTSTGDVELAGGVSSTGCTVTNSNGNLSCSGTITSNGVVLAQYVQRNTGAISPFNITDDLLLGGVSTSTAKFAFLNNTGAG